MTMTSSFLQDMDYTDTNKILQYLFCVSLISFLCTYILLFMQLLALLILCLYTC